jgi:hypothetical protein
MSKSFKKNSSVTIDKLIVSLFTLICDECKTPIKSSSKEGFSFEDRVSQKAYAHMRKYPVMVLPPRSTLNYPTISGLKHQFDGIVVDENIFYVIECKKRGTAVIDQVFSFNSKILDYALKDEFSNNFQIKGIFLCTAEITDNIRKYAFAYGILPIDSTLPPLQAIIDQIPEKDILRDELVELKRRLMVPLPDALKMQFDGCELFHRYMICRQKWKGKGYE